MFDFNSHHLFYITLNKFYIFIPTTCHYFFHSYRAKSQLYFLIVFCPHPFVNSHLGADLSGTGIFIVQGIFLITSIAKAWSLPVEREARSNALIVSEIIKQGIIAPVVTTHSSMWRTVTHKSHTWIVHHFQCPIKMEYFCVQMNVYTGCNHWKCHLSSYQI